MEGIKSSQKLLLAAGGAAIVAAGMGMVAAQPALAKGQPSISPVQQNLKVGQSKTITVTVKGNHTKKALANVPVTWTWTNKGGDGKQEVKITNKGAKVINKRTKATYTTKTDKNGKATVKVKALSNGVSEMEAAVTFNGHTESYPCIISVKGAVNGTKVTTGTKADKAQYQVTSSKYAAYNKAKVSKNAKNATVAKKVKIYGKNYTVNKIAKKAFKGTKVKTVTVKSTKLTKKGVKDSLKGSKVTTVKVPKAQYKKYKTYFTKANAGKEVTVKRA